MNTMRSSPYGGIESKRKVSILPEVGGRRSKKRKKRMISSTIEDPSTPVITSGKYLKDLLLSSKQDNELVRTWAREIDLKRLRSESSTPEGSSLTLLERKRLASSIVPNKEEVEKIREERRDDLECRDAAVVIQRAYRRRLWTRRTAFVSLQSLFRGRSVRVKVAAAS